MVRDRLLSPAAVGGADRAPADPAAPGRVSTGLPGLDALLGGGFPGSRAVLLCGRAGTGKTTFGLQFLLDGLQHGDRAVFVTVDEKPRHLIEDAASSLGWDFSGPIQRADLLVLDASPYFTATRTGTWTGRGIDPRHVAGDLVQQVRKFGARRVVIDSLTSLVPPDLAQGHAYDYLRSLIQSWEDNLGCTVLMTCRGSRLDANGSCEAGRALASGVLELRLVQRGHGLARSLRVRKMRGAGVQPADYTVILERYTGLALADGAPAADVERIFRPRLQPVVDGARPPSGHPAAVSRA